MSGYEGKVEKVFVNCSQLIHHAVEHNISTRPAEEQHRRRPDLSTFFAALDQVDTTGDRQPQNVHSLPLPGDVGAAFRLLANAFHAMRSDNASPEDAPHNELMDNLVQSLMASADDPPTQVEGVSDEFIAALDRVDKKELTESMSCPICANPFLDDKYPLVVRLPCHTDHMFDLECIQPWLKLNPTCPLDRQSMKEKKVEVVKSDEDEEAEYDDMYA